MPARQEQPGRVTDSAMLPVARIEALDVAEREAIGVKDWARLGHVLDEQKHLWRELMRALEGDCPEITPPDAAAGIRLLYQVRRSNHRLIEQQSQRSKVRLTQLRERAA